MVELIHQNNNPEPISDTSSIDPEGYLCPVCHEYFTNGFVKLFCNHIHCLSCLLKMFLGFNYKCSICRDNYAPELQNEHHNQVFHNNNNNDDDDSEEEENNNNMEYVIRLRDMVEKMWKMSKFHSTQLFLIIMFGIFCFSCYFY